ncbi:HNH endonuclease, partial [Bacillus cereus]|nr:HNH endonuclease [Bacillus cereus]MDA2538065.1 HNH endonuclease [Bacillus cereus]
MAKEYAKRFYKSTAWKKCRGAYIAATLDGMCEHCKEVPGYIVDHIVEITPVNIN